MRSQIFELRVEKFSSDQESNKSGIEMKPIELVFLSKLFFSSIVKLKKIICRLITIFFLMVFNEVKIIFGRRGGSEVHICGKCASTWRKRQLGRG